MGQWIHRLSDINIESMTANCENCGNVKVKNKDGRPKCIVGIRTQNASINRKIALGGIGECPICLRTRKLYRDHDHLCCDQIEKSCGECFRGYICESCNKALGFFRDDPKALFRAIDYLTGSL